MDKVSKNTLNTIDWFKERGFLLGRDKPREVYYIIDGATGKREIKKKHPLFFDA